MMYRFSKVFQFGYEVQFKFWVYLQGLEWRVNRVTAETTLQEAGTPPPVSLNHLDSSWDDIWYSWSTWVGTRYAVVLTHTNPMTNGNNINETSEFPPRNCSSQRETYTSQLNRDFGSWTEATMDVHERDNRPSEKNSWNQILLRVITHNIGIPLRTLKIKNKILQIRDQLSTLLTALAIPKTGPWARARGGVWTGPWTHALLTPGIPPAIQNGWVA